MNPNNNFFGIKVSKTGIPVNQASDKQLIYKDDFTTKTYFDLTHARMLEGLLPDGSYGLWVSKPGYDVRTATNDQLIFNSSQNIFKIIDSDTVTLTPTNTGSPNFTVAADSYSTSVSFSSDIVNPGIIAFFSLPFSLTIGGYPVFTGDPQALPYFAATGASAALSSIFYGIGTGSLTFYYNQFSSLNFGQEPIITFTYFILQETVS